MILRRSARAALLALACAAPVVAGACSVYDSSLLEGTGGSGGDGSTVTSTTGQGGAASSTTGEGGATSTTTTTTTTSTTSTGGACQTAADCPGQDTECATRTCTDGVCGVDHAAAGTVLASQTTGDCSRAECDGNGGVVQEPDDSDLPDDGKECTDDACNQGSPSNTPKSVGTACTQNGGAMCNAAGDCVECVLPTDCASLVCDPITFTCVAASCNDGVENGDESDKDCGGSCGKCATGSTCGVDGDCVGGTCANGTCQPTCTDGVQNQTESDVDCGGSCPACDLGKACGSGADCASAVCAGSTCTAAIKIGEVRTRGPGGAGDEFVELYNASSDPVVLDSSWKLYSRSSNSASYTTRWTGNGVTIPPHAHLLLGGAGYAGVAAADASLSSGVTDAGSLVLGHPTTAEVVDAVCFAYDAATTSALQGGGYVCEGNPVMNAPHNDKSSLATNVDASIERLPGGASGNGTDTGNNAADFLPAEDANSNLHTSNPQDLASPPAP